MSTQPADRLLRLSESETIAMARRSRELAAQGKPIISLSLGEPDFNTPEFIKEAAKQAIDQDFSHYTPISGYQDLREAISRKFKRDNNLEYAPDQIVVSTGAKQSIANAVLALINPGDEVIIPKPYWVTYAEIIKLAEGIPVFIESGVEQDYKFTAAQLEAAIGPRSRMMIFSSPCNPSGSVFTHEELSAIADVVRRHPNLLVISDEIYELITFSGKHHSLAAFPGLYDQVITVNGLSKGFAMTGWRLGYLGAPKWIAQACDKLQGQFTSATCSITQRAAIAALDADPSVTEPMRQAFLRRRNLMLGWLEGIPGLILNVPQGAFYLFPDVSAFFGRQFGNRMITNAQDLCFYLLEEGHVGTVPGDAFGMPNCIRLSYAASEKDLETAAQRLRKALADLE